MISADDYQHLPLIKVVGISASGKSTLVQALRRRGYHARPVSQEHSNVGDLWKQFGLPKILVYLDVRLDIQRQRRPDVEWSEKAHFDEIEKLKQALENADLRIDTSGLPPAKVLQVALAFLRQHKIRHSKETLPPIPSTGSFAP